MNPPWQRKLLLCLFLGLSSCGKTRLDSDGRLHESSASFSYRVPEGWSLSKPAGMEFHVVADQPRDGMQANLFVDGVEDGSLEDRRTWLTESYERRHREVSFLSQEPFQTDDGLSGWKLSSTRRSKDGLLIQGYHYLLQDDQRVLLITGSCAEASAAFYEAQFDQAMRSLKRESHNE